MFICREKQIRIPGIVSQTWVFSLFVFCLLFFQFVFTDFIHFSVKYSPLNVTVSPSSSSSNQGSIVGKACDPSPSWLTSIPWEFPVALMRWSMFPKPSLHCIFVSFSSPVRWSSVTVRLLYGRRVYDLPRLTIFKYSVWVLGFFSLRFFRRSTNQSFVSLRC